MPAVVYQSVGPPLQTDICQQPLDVFVQPFTVPTG